jgi:hypothetical protein
MNRLIWRMTLLKNGCLAGWPPAPLEVCPLEPEVVPLELGEVGKKRRPDVSPLATGIEMGAAMTSAVTPAPTTAIVSVSAAAAFLIRM